jgi:hypothetical protein
MSIKARIEDALLLYQNGRYEGAFLNVLVAVSATSRLEIPDRAINDRECFEKFLDKKHRGVIKVEFRGELHTIPHIFYKWFRCELVHEGGLPIDVEFMKTHSMSIRAGGKPKYVLQISHGWFHWLVNSVVEASCNEKEFKKSGSRVVTPPSNSGYPRHSW